MAAASSSRPCCPGLAPCCPFPSFIFNRAAAHLRHTDRTQNHPHWLLPVPFSSVRSTLDVPSRLPAAIAALQARPTTCLPVCLTTCLPTSFGLRSFVPRLPPGNQQSQTQIPLLPPSSAASDLTCLLSLPCPALSWPRPALASPHLAFCPDLPLNPFLTSTPTCNLLILATCVAQFCQVQIRPAPPLLLPPCANDLYVHAVERPRSPNCDDQTAAPATPDCPRRPSNGTAPMRHAKVDSKR